MSQEQNRLANRSAALRWGGFVVGLLSVQVLGGVFAIYLATGDPSVAVVPDYHEKALNWDEQIELQKQSAELNWNVQLNVTPAEAGQSLVMQIKDDDGGFVRIKSGSVQIYHHARAGAVLRVPVSSPGEPIVVKDCFSRSGLWQIDMDLVDANGKRFVASKSVNVTPAVETS